MKVVVCVKQTPSTTAVFSVKDGAVSWEDPGGKPNVVNPWDEYAVEEAIKFKEDRGATDAIALCVGDSASDEALKTCLAMGRTEAIHVSDPALAGSDTLGTARTRAAASSGAGGHPPSWRWRGPRGFARPCGGWGRGDGVPSRKAPGTRRRRSRSAG